jgi:ketosteroid isomerase-like protein
VSEGNVDIVRSVMAAFNRGDVEAVVALLDEDVEVLSTDELPNPGRFHGPEGYLTWIGRWLDAWDEFTVEALELEAVDEHHVVAAVRQRGRGRLSGIETTMNVANLFEVRDGRIVRFHIYADRQGALEAVSRG